MRPGTRGESGLAGVRSRIYRFPMKKRLAVVLSLSVLAAGCESLVMDSGPSVPPSSPQSPRPAPAPAPTSGKAGASGGTGRRVPQSPAPQSPASPQSPQAPSAPSTPSAPAQKPDVSGAVANAVRGSRGADRLTLRDGNRPVLDFQARATLPAGVPEVYRRGGYIARVMTPGGRVVTDDFPAKHVHHHGIWTAWTKTVFEGRQPDFWNMGDGKGRVEFIGVDATSPTRVRSRSRYVDMTVKPERAALEEFFDVQMRPSLSAPRPANVFDVALTQSCVTSSPLQLSEYHYGGLGFRGRSEWDGAANCQFLTSEGITDRVKAHGTKVRWCHVSGRVDGVRAGIAILCHPSNFRAPQPIRVHPDEPFLCFAPPQGGAFTIQPGKPYQARYRFVAFEGEPNKAWLDQLWNQYAKE